MPNLIALAMPAILGALCVFLFGIGLYAESVMVGFCAGAFLGRIA